MGYPLLRTIQKGGILAKFKIDEVVYHKGMIWRVVCRIWKVRNNKLKNTIFKAYLDEVQEGG